MNKKRANKDGAQSNKKRQRQGGVKFNFDEEISDDGSDDGVFGFTGDSKKSSQQNEEEDEESDQETATETRVRLAKELLRSYKEDVRKDNRSSSFDEDDSDEEHDAFSKSKDTAQRGITGDREETAMSAAVSQRLHDDVRKATGKIFTQCADVLTTCDPSEVTNTFYRGHNKASTCVTLSHDEKSAWTGSKDCSIIRWDVETGKRVSKYAGGHITRADRKKDNGKSIHAAGHSNEVLAITCTTDGKYVASGGRDSTIRLWDVRSNELIDTFKGHRDIISALAFQKYTHTLFSGSHDRTVKIWNMTERMYVDTLFGHQAEVTCLDCLRRERVIRYVCKFDCTFLIFDLFC